MKIAKISLLIFVLAGCLIPGCLFSETSQAMNRKIVEQFADAINAHDVSRISSLMSDDPLFLNAYGEVMEGKEQMLADWKKYFEAFPGYRIEFQQVFEDGSTVAAFGIITNEAETGSWRVPASWRVIVENGKVGSWSVIADNRVPLLENFRQKEAPSHPRATGIGGIFFKCKDPKAIKEWYKANLGLNTDDYGTCFVWYQGVDSTRSGYTQWSPFSATTKYFEPSTREFMINYRVDGLDALIVRFKENGVTICDEVEAYEYGRFVHIMDPEGNKIELWEPVDKEFAKVAVNTTK